MKRVLTYLSSAVLVSLAICSCDKDRNLKKILEEAHDAVHGSYELVSMEWLGKGFLDLDGDGSASDNLYLELSSSYERKSPGFWEMAIKKNRITTDGGFRYTNPTIEQLRQGYLSLDIPTQGLQKTTLNGEIKYTENLYFHNYVPSYKVQDDGSYSVELLKKGSSDDDSFPDSNHIKENGGIVTMLFPGRVQLDMDCLFYDHKTESIVTGPVRLCYERYSMQTK